jgi:aerobic C4-dicarboxylate transport protein
MIHHNKEKPMRSLSTDKRSRKPFYSVIALVGTLSVVPTIPVAGMALILGIDRFMSEARAIVNVIGNGVATVVISRSEGELDLARVNAVLDGRMADAETAGTRTDLVDSNPVPTRNRA